MEQLEKLRELVIDRIDCDIKELAKRIGISREMLSRIVNGTYAGKKLRFETLYKICDYFNVDKKDYL